MVSHFHDCIHYNERAFFAELLERVRSLGRDIKTTRFVVKNVTVFRAVVLMSNNPLALYSVLDKVAIAKIEFTQSLSRRGP